MQIARKAQGRAKARFGWRHAGGTLLLLAVTVLFAFPLVSMILAPLRQPGLPPPRGIELLPENPSLRSYSDAFTLVPLGRAVVNSGFVALIAVPITIVTASWAGLAMTLIGGWRQKSAHTLRGALHRRVDGRRSVDGPSALAKSSAAFDGNLSERPNTGAAISFRV